MSVRMLLSYLGIGRRDQKPQADIQVRPAQVERWQAHIDLFDN